jgi:large subunit ribosomal protein L33
MAKKGRPKIRLQSQASSYYYTTDKSARPKDQGKKASRTTVGGKLVLKKYDPIVRKHVEFKEERIKG